MILRAATEGFDASKESTLTSATACVQINPKNIFIKNISELLVPKIHCNWVLGHRFISPLLRTHPTQFCRGICIKIVSHCLRNIVDNDWLGYVVWGKCHEHVRQSNGVYHAVHGFSILEAFCLTVPTGCARHVTASEQLNCHFLALRETLMSRHHCPGSSGLFAHCKPLDGSFEFF